MTEPHGESCRYPSCPDDAVVLVNGQPLCERHGNEYGEHLQSLYQYYSNRYCADCGEGSRKCDGSCFAEQMTGAQDNE